MANSTWSWIGGTGQSTSAADWTLLSGPGDIAGYPGPGDTMIDAGGTILTPIDTMLSGNTIEIASTAGAAGLVFGGDGALTPAAPTLDRNSLIESQIGTQTAAGAGSFGSLLADRLDGFVLVCGEVVERFGWGEAAASDEGEGGVAQGGEDLGCCAGAGSPLILSPGDVADIVQAVLDPPVGTRQGEQARRRGLGGGQAGDGIDGLGTLFAVQPALAGQAADLRHAGPGRREMRGQGRGHLDAAGLDPAMGFVAGSGRLAVRRWRPFRTGGNPARRPGRCRLSAPADCLSR